MSLCPTCGQKIKEIKEIKEIKKEKEIILYTCPYCFGSGEIGQDRMECPVCLRWGVISLDPDRIFPKPTNSIKDAHEAGKEYWKHRYNNCSPNTYPPELWWSDGKCRRCREKITTGHFCKDLV